MPNVMTPVMPPSITPSPTPLPRATAAADPSKMRKSAHDFEAMAISQLLQPMFDTVQPGPFSGGAGEQAWKPMFVDALAKQIAQHGGLGLAKPIYEAMQRMQEGKHK